MAFPELTEEQQLILIDECCEEEHKALEKTPGHIFEGVVETIKKLSEKYKVCIVSNCQAGSIELTMKCLGIEKYITDFECPGYTNLPKGENCKLVMERNGFTSAVYVGDTQGDADASAFAGIPFVYCAYGFGKPDTYDYKIEKFPELLDLF
jgi:phosphoglycolate phosphatase